VDLLRAQAAVLPRQQQEDLLAGAAGSMPGARQLAVRVLVPGGPGRDGIAPDANENDFQ
jgi:hypothetical protein